MLFFQRPLSDKHATYKLTGSETNCIGAWSLTTQLTTNPVQKQPNRYWWCWLYSYDPSRSTRKRVETTKAVGLVTNVNGTTVTVQCPEA